MVLITTLLLLLAAFPPATGLLHLMELDDGRSPAAYTVDNALDPDYRGSYTAASLSGAGLETASIFSESGSVNHAIYTASNNLTSALVINGTDFKGTYITVEKSGYAGDVWSSELNGVNAALSLVSNATAQVSYGNITTHNGAIGCFATNRSAVKIERSDIYTTGPGAHGLWSSMAGNVTADSVYVSTSGARSAAFGVGPQGKLTVDSAIVRTIGAFSSPVFLATGEDGSIEAEHVMANADASPLMIIDGSHRVKIDNCDMTSTGGLAGILVTHSNSVQSNPQIRLTNSIIIAEGEAPALWFGNTRADITIHRTAIVAMTPEKTVGTFVVANSSQTTQEYDAFGPTTPNSTFFPARVDLAIEEGSAMGDFLSVDGGMIYLSLSQHSEWIGSTYTTSQGSPVSRAGIHVSLTNDSQWLLTGHDAVVGGFYDQDKTLSNVVSNGFNILYDANNTMSAWLGARVYPLLGGGSLSPYAETGQRRSHV